ncbi:MAG: 1-acyl-sn-glycerol-3-phosphate acyltransferase [Chthoniobacterales bacterium]|jgi:1-acyl-sn-glycerol-3-phosphate acyltransferase|nr:1-acyl-sn-glycerol-3-phosphate acyltransferase [Chthoniobacterales bacterium]
MNLWYWTGYYLATILARLFFSFRVVHRERQILRGPVILAMNHQSYLDPPLAGISSGREVYFLARKTLLDGPVLGRLLRKLNVVPVDQEGTDRRALKALLRILKAGNGTVVFPEGARTRDGKLQPALPGLGFVIAKTKAPVLPMRIFGAREALPRGSSRLRLCRITVVIGKPLHFTEADLQPAGKELYQRLSERVMDAIAALQLD